MQACADFEAARRTLAGTPCDLLITQLRLGPFNGLHLVYLARARLIRSVVYDETMDPFLAREAQSAARKQSISIGIGQGPGGFPYQRCSNLQGT